jgi:hypothetical protein
MLQVYIFDFPLRENQDFQFIQVLDGTQMGEYFGSALCVVDLNGDRLDDLVIAAPQFSLQAANSDHLVGDEGRIYIFINHDYVSTRRQLQFCVLHEMHQGIAYLGTLFYDSALHCLYEQLLVALQQSLLL